ncbi:Lar family restriction alleviation protein [Pseudomonas aeruginosa]
MAEELKPCPFCGETPGADSYAHADGGCKYGAISCSCGVIGPDVRTGYKKWPEWRDSAITAWNERAVPAGHVVVSEALLRRLARPADRYDEVFTLDRHEAAEELRALLSEQEGGNDVSNHQ